METGMSKRLEEARAAVDELCERNGLDLHDVRDWQGILWKIDAEHNRRTYKCKRCWDSGIVSWIDPDDGMFYGRRCGYCRYWDEQKEKARAEKERKGL